ncbi:hypothetical protein L6452_41243 [Arctium lappa]|uniref:Uncharacterized protein n=1 Tax=Arctium lappa TaxID=4217 RepID=A0ACB8XP63_ARCLA|nr:hypothetical protein L6452_41243 [Arctium lappa]
MAVATKKTCDKSFCEDYLLLSPKDVGLWDLIMLLISKNIGSRKFIDCPAGTVEGSFSRRFVIFISIVAQKILHLIYKPFRWLGSVIEFGPNFLDINGGFLNLPLNLITVNNLLQKVWNFEESLLRPPRYYTEVSYNITIPAASAKRAGATGGQRAAAAGHERSDPRRDFLIRQTSTPTIMTTTTIIFRTEASRRKKTKKKKINGSIGGHRTGYRRRFSWMMLKEVGSSISRLTISTIDILKAPRQEPDWAKIVGFKHSPEASSTARGRLVLPDRTSSEYVSAVGLGDIRRTLDSKIKHDDPRYTSALAVMAAKSAYENPAYIKDTVEKHWKMEFLGFFNCWNDYEEDYTTQGFMWSDKTGDSELIGVSFRGTSPFNAKDWSSDVDLSWYHLPTIGKVHAGFLKALGLQKSKGWPKDIHANEQKLYAYYAMKKKLKERLQKNPQAKFMVTGHSLGATLATVFPAILAYHKEIDLLSKLEGVYTFGQPRVGDHKFGEYMKEVLVTHGLRYHRFVYCNDLVPRVPFDNFDQLFKHFGGCHYYNSFYKGQVLPEEPNKNYFSIFAIIPMFVNAVWELLRSFIIYYQDGPDYCETFSCRGLRLVGLLIAGLPAHGPQDYINLTRLGSPELFKYSSLDHSTNGVK